MNWSIWTRKTHRWASVTFILISAAIWIALGIGIKMANWVFFIPLLPLAILALSGTYMFVLPYRTRTRGGDQLNARSSKSTNGAP